MDIKLKKYKFSIWFKLLAIILCIAGMLTLAYGLLQAPYFKDALDNTDFKESSYGKNILQQPIFTIWQTFKFRNEEYIKSGLALSQNEIRDRKLNIENSRTRELHDVQNGYDTSVKDYQYSSNSDIISDEINKNAKNIADLLTKQKLSKLKQVNALYDKLLNNVEADLIKEQLNSYKTYIERLENDKGILYTVVEDNNTLLSNIKTDQTIEEYFKCLPLSKKLTKDDIDKYISDGEDMSAVSPNTVVYIGLSPDRYKAELQAYNERPERGLEGIRFCAMGLLTFLIGLIYLIYSAGKRPDKDGVHLIFIDRVYLDIALAVSLGIILLCLIPLSEFYHNWHRTDLNINWNLMYFIFGAIIAIGTFIGITFVTMLAKRVKRHEVIQQIFICRLCKWLIRNFKKVFNTIFDKSPMAIRLVLIFGAYAFAILIFTFLLCMYLIHGNGKFLGFIGFIGLVGVNIIAIYYLMKTFNIFNNIKKGAERIRAGELNYSIPEQGISELRQLSSTINSMAEGLKSAVSSQVKAERMKAELITNVSHDLKTPLTSIITYVDLLKSEGLNSENAEKYLEIIDSKSQRLKSLTEDLFEAAKASSGNISVNYERINVAALMGQGMGELSDKIRESGLNFKINVPKTDPFVNADGKLLWRVIENLLSNVFKYAQPKSRVYIDITEVDKKVYIVIKNISAYELNISEDELMERFKRGDESRHSEGSGLGLSIVKSLTELQGGSFSINIDGDLFKAIVELPAAI